MKRFLISLIIGSCLIGVGLVVSIYEFEEWSNNAVDIYELGYQEMSETFRFELEGNELVIRSYSDDGQDIEIIYVENLGSEVILTVTYPKDLYTIRENFDGKTLRIYSKIYNYTKLIIDMIEKQCFVKNAEDVVKITIEVDSSVHVKFND